MESSRYLFATSDFRNQNKHEKAAELHFITGCTYEEAGEAFGVSKAAVFRARKALEKGRDAGKNGRPNRMSAEIMELYMEKVEFWLDLYEEITYAKAIEMAGDVFKSNINNFADGIPTFDYKWVKKTFADHNISMRSPRPVETERLLSISTIIESIQNLEEIIKSKNIPPELMINGDETQVRTLTSRRKVASRNGTGQPVTEEHPEDEHVTLLLLVTASGHHFKPLLIFPLKTVPPLDKRIIAAFRITGSDNGWIDKKIMQNYVENIFLEELEEYRKNLKMGDQWAILILDNHSSRNSLTNCVLFEAHKLVIFFLPPHSSAVMQPLDLGPNLRIKRVFSNLYIPNAKEDRPARRNSKLIALLRAISEGCCANIILSGWEKAGLYPINPATVLGSKMVRPDNIQELREVGRKRGPHMDGGKILSNGVIVHPSSSTEKENQPPKKQRVKNTNKENALNVLN